jgi:hypothetical protein
MLIGFGIQNTARHKKLVYVQLEKDVEWTLVYDRSSNSYPHSNFF